MAVTKGCSIFAFEPNPLVYQTLLRTLSTLQLQPGQKAVVALN